MAQYNVGLMYQRGDGVARDDTEAVDWYRKAPSKVLTARSTNLA